MTPVYVPRDPHEKAMQRALMQYYIPTNHALVREALLKAGRDDLIGWGAQCLIPPYIREKKKDEPKKKDDSRRKGEAKKQDEIRSQRSRAAQNHSANSIARGSRTERDNDRRGSRPAKHGERNSGRNEGRGRR